MTATPWPASGLTNSGLNVHLEDILYSQGFGTRRVCAGLIGQGRVQVLGPDGVLGSTGAAQNTRDFATLDALGQGLRFQVQGVDWQYHAKAYLMLHKPAGTECSQKPSTWPSVYTLLPAPLRQPVQLPGYPLARCH